MYTLLIALATSFWTQQDVVPGSMPINAYVSVGDSQHGRNWLPIDSPATAKAWVERLKHSHNVSTIYWRGEQNRTIINHAVTRAENLQFSDYWQEWQRYLNFDAKINEAAVKEAHRQGIKIYSQEGWFDLGASGGAGYATLPYPFEYKLRIEHPEWCPQDRYGLRHQDGPIEFCYPEARKTLIDILVDSVRSGSYDGLMLYSYFENFGTRYAEEFGFNQPIVDEYKRRYSVDIRNQKYDSQKWAALRGEYATLFLKELKKALQGKKLAVTLSALDPDRPQEFPMNSGRVNCAVQMDWKSWVKNRLVDEIIVMGGGDVKGKALAMQLVQAGCPKVTLTTERPYTYEFEELRSVGVILTCWSGPSRSQTVESYSLLPVTRAELTSSYWFLRAKALHTFATQMLPSEIVKFTNDAHPYVRREAWNQIEATRNLGARDQAITALKDSEESVRIAAAGALEVIGNSRSVHPLFDAISASGHLMFVDTCVSTLRKIGVVSYAPFARALQSPHEAVRIAAIRVVCRLHSKASREAILLIAESDPSFKVRAWALEELPIELNDRYLSIIERGLWGESSVLRNTCIRAIKRAHRAAPPAIAALFVQQISTLFQKSSQFPNEPWLWQTLGDCLHAYGTEALQSLTKHSNPQVSRRAISALHAKQNDSGYISGSREADEKVFRRLNK